MANSNSINSNTAISGSINADNFSRYEICAVSIIFFSDALVMSGKYSLSGTLEWLCTAISAFISIPVIMLSSRVIKSKEPGNIIKAFIITVSAFFIFISLFIFGEFVYTCVLPELNQFLIPAGIFLLSVYSASKRFSTLNKSIHIIVPIIGLFLIFSFILTFTRLDIKNVTYPSETGGMDILLALVVYTLVFSIKGILLLYLFKYEKSPHNDGTAVSIGLAAYGIIMALILLSALAVLGPGLYLSLDFPLYYPLGLTHFGYYFERAEILSLIIFMTTLVCKTGIYLRIIRKSIGHKK